MEVQSFVPDSKSKPAKYPPVVVSTVVFDIKLDCGYGSNKSAGIESVYLDVSKKLVTVMGIMDLKQLLQYLSDNLRKKVETVPPKNKDDDKKDAQPTLPPAVDTDKTRLCVDPGSEAVRSVVLKIGLHCGTCTNKILKVISGVTGVESVSVDRAKNLVTVKGSMDAVELQQFLTVKTKRSVHIVSAQEGEGSSRVHEQESIAVTMPEIVTETIQHENGAKSWEIIQSIVVGGLFESITSLVIVTSATAANIFDGNVIALAFTSLIAGFFIIRRDVSITLNEHRPRTGILTTALHYIFHYVVATLSFILFGLVAPLVYAFTFPNSDRKFLNLAATAGASLLCTALLAALKAHVQKLKQQIVSYIRTTSSFVCFGAVAFFLSYLAGALFGKLVNELDWFEY